MKKGALVFVLVLAVVLIAGCSKIGTDPFTEWSNSPPVYYSLFNLKYSTQINSAVYNDDESICNEIIDEEVSRESIGGAMDCRLMITKSLAFKEKSYDICNSLNFEGDQKDYEECIAPIVAFSAISLNDIEYCQKYLNNERLVKLCGEDYEKYA